DSANSADVRDRARAYLPTLEQAQLSRDLEQGVHVAEDRGYGVVGEDVVNRLGENVGDGEDGDALRLRERGDRNGVGDDDAVEGALLDPLDRRRREDRMRRAGVD